MRLGPSSLGADECVRPYTGPRHLVLVFHKILLAPRGPARRQLHRFPHASLIRRVLRALVERHDDVGAEPDLRLHGALRTEEVRRAVEMRAEGHSFFTELPQLAEAEDLKSARIGENRAIPRHESV